MQKATFYQVVSYDNQSFWYENVWRAVSTAPLKTDNVSDFTENHSLNMINVKQYGSAYVSDEPTLGEWWTNFRRVMNQL
jgi:hypothetical protein